MSSLHSGPSSLACTGNKALLNLFAAKSSVINLVVHDEATISCLEQLNMTCQHLREASCHCSTFLP